MKTASTALINLLATRQFYTADMFTFTLQDGTVLRYTSGDIDITLSGNKFLCGGTTGPYFRRTEDDSTISWKVGLEVDTLTFGADPGPSGTIEGFSFSKAVQLGIFDNCDVLLQRVYMPTYGDTTPGAIIVFNGVMGEVDAGRFNAITFNVNSYTELLDMQMPRTLYQAGCVNTLYDSACTLIKSSLGISSTVASGSTVSMFNATLAAATGYFDKGTISFTSGPNAGLSRGVKSYIHGTPSSFLLNSPVPFTPTVGDAFTIYPGCDKAQTTCLNKFSNLANFRGMPYVPQPETSI